jgi:hypothetical protein
VGHLSFLNDGADIRYFASNHSDAQVFTFGCQSTWQAAEKQIWSAAASVARRRFGFANQISGSRYPQQFFSSLLRAHSWKKATQMCSDWISFFEVTIDHAQRRAFEKESITNGSIPQRS